MAAEHSSQQLFLGIDGGGTKCKAVIVAANGTVLGTGKSGPANPMRDMALAKSSIVESALLALKDAGLDESSLCNLIAGVGLAGVSVPACKERFLSWQHPFSELYLTTDLHIACIGAHHAMTGAVIITGTGSSGIACNESGYQVHGGHGFPQGDIGSGAWIGLQAIQKVLMSMDGLAPETDLKSVVLDYLNCKEATDIVEAIAGTLPSKYAQIAPLVIDEANNGDEVAQAIMEQSGQYISGLARKLLSYEPQRLSIIGGVATPMLKWMDEDVVTKLSEALSSPEIGAVHYAQHQVA